MTIEIGPNLAATIPSAFITGMFFMIGWAIKESVSSWRKR